MKGKVCTGVPEIHDHHFAKHLEIRAFLFRFKDGSARPLFRLFVEKVTLVVSRIRTHIVGEDGEDPDH